MNKYKVLFNIIDNYIIFLLGYYKYNGASPIIYISFNIKIKLRIKPAKLAKLALIKFKLNSNSKLAIKSLYILTPLL